MNTGDCVSVFDYMFDRSAYDQVAGASVSRGLYLYVLMEVNCDSTSVFFKELCVHVCVSVRDCVPQARWL